MTTSPWAPSLFALVLAIPASLHAQPAAFDVVSIKPTDSASRVIGWDIRPGGRVHAAGIPLLILIATAYDVPFQSKRLTGGPDWLNDRYDIDAAPAPGTIPPGVSGKALDARVHPMLQAMLADRFKLVIRHETKELPIYVVTVAKGGAKLKPAEMQEADCPTEPGTGPTCHNLGGGMGRGIHGTAVDIDDIALFASNWADRPIVNRSGLKGLFAVDTEGWTLGTPRQPREDGLPDPEAERMADPSRPTISMIFSRLGLTLESSKGPVDSYIIESVQRPTAN